MSNQVFLISDPDDVHQDGVRVLFVNLDQEQTQFVSACLTELEQLPTVIIYVWNTGDDVEWLLDKKHKSSFILFNADNINDIINGYLAAHKNSYYLGTLRALNKANVNQINSKDQLIDLLERVVKV